MEWQTTTVTDSKVVYINIMLLVGRRTKFTSWGSGESKVMILDQLLGGIGEILKRNHNTVANRKVLRRNITKPSEANAAKVGPSCCFIAQSKCVARRVAEHLLCLRFIKVWRFIRTSHWDESRWSFPSGRCLAWAEQTSSQCPGGRKCFRFRKAIENPTLLWLLAVAPTVHSACKAPQK